MIKPIIITKADKETKKRKKDCVGCLWGDIDNNKFGVHCSHILVKKARTLKKNRFITIKYIQKNGMPDWCPYLIKGIVSEYYMFRNYYEDETTPTIKR